MGAGIMSGAGEIAGFDELMKGDFAGAMKKRKDVWEAEIHCLCDPAVFWLCRSGYCGLLQVASSEEGRAALRQKALACADRATKSLRELLSLSGRCGHEAGQAAGMLCD